MSLFNVGDHQRSIGIPWTDVEVAIGGGSETVELDRVFEEDGLTGSGRNELESHVDTRIRGFDSMLRTAGSLRFGRLFRKATWNRTAGRNDLFQTPASSTQISEKLGKMGQLHCRAILKGS